MVQGFTADRLNVEVQVAAVGGESCVFDEIFSLLDGRETVIGQDVFLDDNAVDVVGSGVQSHFPQGEAHA